MNDKGFGSTCFVGNVTGDAAKTIAEDPKTLNGGVFFGKIIRATIKRLRDVVPLLEGEPQQWH